MTDAELRNECQFLTAIQQQYENASINNDTTLFIQLLDGDIKHVYSKRLAIRITKAIARAIECERIELINKFKKHNKNERNR